MGGADAFKKKTDMAKPRQIVRVLMPWLCGLLGIFVDTQITQGRRKPPLTLVELFGLPGAGKTTVVQAFAQRATVTTRKDLTAEWANCSALQRLVHVGRALGNFRLLTAAVRFAVGSRLNTRESQFRLLRLVAKTEWLKSRSGVVLLDQGFLQDIWSIFLSSKTARANPALLRSLIGSLYERIDATIVVLEVNAETAAERVSTRPHGESRFDKLPEGQLRDSIAAASGLQRQIVESARLAALPFLIVDASPPIEAVTDRLLSLVPATQMTTSAERTLPRPRRIPVVEPTGAARRSWPGE